MWNNINLSGTATIYKPDKNSNFFYNYSQTLFNKQDVINILDMGCGSGAIGIALAKYFENSNVTCSDINIRAINEAKENAIQNNVKNINFIKSDLFENISFENKYDLIIAYLPYYNFEMAIKENINRQRFLTSLIVGNDSDDLALIKKVIINGLHFLNNNGYILLKVGNINQITTINELIKNFPYTINFLSKEEDNLASIILLQKQDDNIKNELID